MILSGQSILRYELVSPFHERTRHNGMTFGVGPAGYDVRVAETLSIKPGGFTLASTVERFTMHKGILGIVHDKSTWARLGLAAQNTVVEPGWCGYLTLELTNHSDKTIEIAGGTPIVQIIFHVLDEESDRPYEGKYQDQAQGAQAARFERN